MAVYVICPHCGHPTVVSRGHTNRGRYCRQCGEVYYIGESGSLEADAVPVRTIANRVVIDRPVVSHLQPVYEVA